MGTRVRVRPLADIKAVLHGRTGTVQETKELSDHNGPYIMFCVALDEPVDLEIFHGQKQIFLPATCFEVI